LDILDHLREHPPRKGPEWGSGGIFGLKYHRGILYYTLSFEAEAYFIDREGLRKKYEFELVGPKPTSGGDTYNAVEAVDEKIYFGGWVHAPAIYRGKNELGATIDFSNKYSHLHYYDIEDDEIGLLWKESMHDPERWVGEVSEIIYNPYMDELLIARADGYTNLGVYSIDRGGGEFKKLADKPALKGSIVLDHACFAIHQYPSGLRGIECIDLIDHKINTVEYNYKEISVDGEDVVNPQVGSVASAYGKIFIFARGGFVVGDIIDNEYYFIRLFDIPNSMFSPLRVNTKVFGGGLLTSYNAYVHSVIHAREDRDKIIKRSLNTIVSPSLLVYFTPPTIKVVGTLGARVTSIEVVKDKIVVGCNTMANTGRYDSAPFDQGVRTFTILSQDIIYNQQPITMGIPGYIIENKVFGGIPLTGYREPRLIVYSNKENEILVNEYIASIPPQLITTDKHTLTPGRNIVDLTSYSGIVSFKLKKFMNEKDYIVIDLK